MRVIKVGTRKSQLALTQTQMVLDCLREKHPEVTFELVPFTTKGDRLVHVSLQTIGGKGVFVKEIEQALLDQRIDLAVHSFKDVPSVLVDGCMIGAVPEREDVRDCLIFKEAGMTLETLPKGAVIGTSSLRREVQLKALRPDVNFQPLRGNIDTRLKKVQTEQYDAIILAVAGLKRLGLIGDGLDLEYLETKDYIPAVAQGALAVECRTEDQEVRDLLASIHDETLASCVELERAFLALMNADCTFPIGAYARLEGGEYHLDALLANAAGDCLTVSLASPNREDLAQKAYDELLKKGALTDKWWNR